MLGRVGVTARTRIRLIVARDNTELLVMLEVPADGLGARVQAGVVSCLRSRSTSSTVACGVSVGVVFGRRDRGSSAVSPSAS